MEDYNKIIESLGVRFIKSKNIKILQSLTVENFYDVGNTIYLLHKGEISFGEEKQKVNEGDLLFIPGGRLTSVTYGKFNPMKLTNEDLLNNRDKFFSSLTDKNIIGQDEDSFSYITFEAKVFDSVNFFASLDIPAFIISNQPKLAEYIIETIKEDLSNNPGKERVIKLNTERVVVEIIRYILEKRLFVEQLATNSTYFKDPRLIDIFAFIKKHLGGDLSNKVLANVANVSEDYVGQYFKMLTGINPQDYIEYQRMEMAVNLLRTSKKSIREIGREVGYKDTAYFCRRFKMMFGIPAGKMRRRESLMNI
ncbi:MAG: helix-turn-helix transcriptional regulator [Sporocytophaga sp.]|jgi:AraC-like DNA-binding protein|uniref:helix-turn-helix domain-containing protein n=1 Tax=Sporocytophaga TaxID=1011 RepID=UPI000416BFBA|nr:MULTISPECIES: helix-turn-helix domain-containing protein [Sporocytophaga]MBO9698985.1 helix-turn-helix transcriptional regulator [Sporocytophaga sp.]MCR6642373.1 AraC family transcriptional regulator [Sporocytophaga sp.]